MGSPISPNLELSLPGQNKANVVQLLIVGESKTKGIFSQAFYTKVDSEANLAASCGLPVIDVEVVEVLTMADEDDIPELKTKRIDYVFLMLNPDDPSCFDRAELEFARIHALLHSKRHVEICLAKMTSTTEMLFPPAQLKTFMNRYQHPTMSTIRFDDNESIKFGASILFNRLREIKISKDSGFP